MSEFRQIDVRAIDLEALGIQIAYVMTDSPARKEVCRRNARLIAAGEDLLEACTNLVQGMESAGITGVYLDMANAVLAKARGEPC